MQKAQGRTHIVTNRTIKRIVKIALKGITDEFYSTQGKLLKVYPNNPGKFYTVTVTVEETEESGWGKDK